MLFRDPCSPYRALDESQMDTLVLITHPPTIVSRTPRTHAIVAHALHILPMDCAGAGDVVFKLATDLPQESPAWPVHPAGAGTAVAPTLERRRPWLA